MDNRKSQAFAEMVRKEEYFLQQQNRYAQPHIARPESHQNLNRRSGWREYGYMPPPTPSEVRRSLHNTSGNPNKPPPPGRTLSSSQSLPSLPRHPYPMMDPRGGAPGQYYNQNMMYHMEPASQHEHRSAFRRGVMQTQELNMEMERQRLTNEPPAPQRATWKPPRQTSYYGKGHDNLTSYYDKINRCRIYIR